MTALSAADLLLLLAAVGWILAKQVGVEPVKPRLLVLAPLLLGWFGLRAPPSSRTRDLADVALLAFAAVVSALLGCAGAHDRRVV